MSANLRPLANQAIAHWREHLPKMYERLKKAEQLENEALKAAEQTLDEQATLIEQGYPPEAAWEIVREKYVFLARGRRGKRGGAGKRRVPFPEGTESAGKPDRRSRS